MMPRLALLAVALIGLAGCGLRPLYSGGTSGPVAQQLAQVTVASIPGKGGWLVRNNLVDRLRDRLGGAALSARGEARRRHHRLRPQAQQPDHA
jgi:hypothetical protein